MDEKWLSVKSGKEMLACRLCHPISLTHTVADSSETASTLLLYFGSSALD